MHKITIPEQGQPLSLLEKWSPPEKAVWKPHESQMRVDSAKIQHHVIVLGGESSQSIFFFAPNGTKGYQPMARFSMTS